MINDKAYWEERFSTGDWQKCNGEKQSEFFAKMLVNALPKWLRKEMQCNDYTVIDYGCAEGAGTAYIARHFPRCSFTGVDFAVSAVENAQKNHPVCNYRVGNIMNGIEQSDIVITSNTLEHFKNPIELLNKLVARAVHHAIILLPFEDDLGIEEHLAVFDAQSLSIPIEGYDLSFFKFIDCRLEKATMWEGKQILLVYTKQTNYKGPRFNMAQIYNETIREYLEGRYEATVHLRAAEAKVKELAQRQKESNELLVAQKEEFECKKQQVNEEKVILEREKQQVNEEKVILEREKQQVNEEKVILEREKQQVNEEKVILEREKQQVGEEKKVIVREIRVMKATTDEIAYWLQVAGRSEPMRAAHFFIQLKHALFGTKEERKECWRWLRGDRSFVCKYSYIHQSAVKAANLLVHLQTIKDISEVALGTIRFCESSNHLCVADGYSQDIPPEEWEKLMDIIDAYEGKSILVLPELIDWNIPLFQRPQQLAMAFAQMGILFIYFTPNGIDNIHSVKKIMGCCVLLPSDWFETTIAFLLQRKLDVILDIWSTDNKHFMPWINQLKERGCRILYEYTDEISESITGHVPQETLERHRSLLNDKETFVVATADKLYNDVLQIRGSGINCLNSSNGVDLKHFKVEDDNKNIPKNVKSIIQKKKPIIGYFGAIANWFDFELVAYAAKLRPEYEFMMIGPNYGSHDLAILDKLVKISNLHFVGSVDYKVLPYVAKSFTVATIPFKLNEITESTSPIKLFEYMAMGKPVVTTAMRECFKYPVVRIAKDKDDYVAALDELVGKAQDEQYLTKILDLAQQNSWSKKAEEIVRLLKIS